MSSISLFEHTTWPDEKNEKQRIQAEEISKSLTALDRQAIKFLQDENIITFDDIKNKGIRIKSKNMIGSIQFSNFKLQIVPKIYEEQKDKNKWKNIAHCIHFARNYSIDKIYQNDRFQVESKDFVLQDFLIKTLVIDCQELIRKGLLKSYIVHEENLPFLRGKLILKNQFQNDMRKKVQFFNEYDELEFDNIENRILLQALIQCRRIVINPRLKKDVLILIHQLTGIVQNIPIKVSDIERMLKRYTRQNRHYENAHIACKTILANPSISDFYEHGKKLSFSLPFFVNMDKIFENFITRIFRDYAIDEVTVKSQSGQKAWNVDEKSEIKMKPDIVLEEKSKPSIIVDVKYKEKLGVDDLYQIGFYIHEYRSIDENEKIEEAYAILPKFLMTEKTQHTFMAEKSKIKIYAKYISMDDCLEWIKETKTAKVEKWNKIKAIFISPNKEETIQNAI